MIAESVDGAEHEVIEPYISCIQIHGKRILPPLMTAKRREEMRHYKEQAAKLEMKRKSLKTSQQTNTVATQNSLKPPNEIIMNEETTNPFASCKSVDAQEILDEFDPFAPSTLNSEQKLRLSGSSDELSTSKICSSNTSVALTNSTDLYHYMDITGSSHGDGRTPRRSLTPLTGGEWDSPPSKPDRQIKATYEGLNEYLDSILISSASSLPSCAKSSDDETTPTNGGLTQKSRCDVQIPYVQHDERPKSCPLSPIPRDSVSDSAIGSLHSEKIIDVVKPHTESTVPRLVRSNSYTLEAPSPMLLAHLEAERKKIASAKNSKKKPIVNNRSKMWNGDRHRNSVSEPKRNESQSTETRSPPKKIRSPVTQGIVTASLHKTRAPSPPKVHVEPKERNKEFSFDSIGQLEVRKLFADLQAEHNRQMEELLIRQRKEQEMVRQAILAQRDMLRGSQTWAQCLGAKEQDQGVCDAAADNDVMPSRDVRKSFSMSFISTNNAKCDQVMTVSAPPGSLVLSMTGTSPKRPSSSPALTNYSVSVPPLELTDTNGNLTREQWILPAQETLSESASSRMETQVSPRTRRRAWDSHHVLTQDPDWLEINRQRQMHWAASKIQAAVRGYLTRRLLRTERVQGCITVIHDTILCALELQKECSRSIEPSDLQLHGRLIHQLSDACKEIHAIFVEFPIAKRLAIIALDRERLESRSPRSIAPRPLSRATQIALNRKMAQNSQSKPTLSANASITRRKNWANLNTQGTLSNSSYTQDTGEIVPNGLVRSSTANSTCYNGDSQKSLGGGQRKPWR